MHIFSALTFVALFVAGAIAAPGVRTGGNGIELNAPHHTVPIHHTGDGGIELDIPNHGPSRRDGNLSARDDDKSEFKGDCNAHSECGTGSLCIAHWCTAGYKLEDGSINLAARDVVHEDNDYWYLEARSAINILDELTGKTEKIKPRDKCPKQCGDGKHCCSNHFCQPPRCLGDFDD